MKMNRVLSLLLALAMLISCFGTAAFAAEPKTAEPAVAKTATKAGEGREIVADWLWCSVAETRGPETLMAEYAQAGVTDLYALVKGTGGKVAWNSSVEGTTPAYSYDILQEIIDAAKPYGIRIHAWMMAGHDSHYTTNIDPQAIQWHFRYGREATVTQRVNLRDEKYMAYMKALVEELVANYDIAGIHLDTIRYGGIYYDWGQDARDTLLTEYGININQYNAATKAMCVSAGYKYTTATGSTAGYNNGASYTYYKFYSSGTTSGNSLSTVLGSSSYGDAYIGAQAFLKMRTDSVNNFIKMVREAAGDKILTAAIMPEPIGSLYNTFVYAQDIDQLADLTDYVTPMLYSTVYTTAASGSFNKNWVASKCETLAASGCNVVAGIQCFPEGNYYSTATNQNQEIPLLLEKAASINPKEGYGDILGYAYFRCGYLTMGNATYDADNSSVHMYVANQKIINSDLPNPDDIKLVYKMQNGMTATSVSNLTGFAAGTTATISSDGKTVTLYNSGKTALASCTGGSFDMTVTGTPSDAYGVAQLYVYSVDGEYNSFCNTTYAGEGNTPVVTEPVVTEPTPTQPEVTEPSQPGTTGTVKAEIIGDWLWTSTVETRGATTLMDEYAKAGITDVYVLVKGTGGKVGWNSSVSGTSRSYSYDMLQTVISAAKPHGIRVHPWIMAGHDDHYVTNIDSGAIAWHFRYGDSGSDGNGGTITRRINLRNTAYINYMKQLVAELCTYDIAGIHLDTIRYGGYYYDWGQTARDLLLTKYGITIDQYNAATAAMCVTADYNYVTKTGTTAGYNNGASYTYYAFGSKSSTDITGNDLATVLSDPSYGDAYIGAHAFLKMRTDSVNGFIDEMRSVMGDKVLSCAIMPEPIGDVFETFQYGQDINSLASRTDYVTPMVYSTVYTTNKQGAYDPTWVAEKARILAESGCNMVPGVQAFTEDGYSSSANELNAEIPLYMEVAKAANAAGKGKALGYAFFRASYMTLGNANYDAETNKVSMFVNNQQSSANTKLVYKMQNGMTCTSVTNLSGFTSGTSATISSDGKTVTFYNNGSSVLAGYGDGTFTMAVTGTASDTHGVAQLFAYTSSGLTNSFCNFTLNNVEVEQPEPTEPTPTEPQPTEPEVTEPTEPQPTEPTVPSAPSLYVPNENCQNGHDLVNRVCSRCGYVEGATLWHFWKGSAEANFSWTHSGSNGTYGLNTADRGVIYSTSGGGDHYFHMTQGTGSMGHAVKTGDVIEVGYRTTNLPATRVNTTGTFELWYTTTASDSTFTSSMVLSASVKRLENTWQTVQFTAPSGVTLKRIMFDVLEEDLGYSGSKVEIDYVYVGPAAGCPSKADQSSLFFGFTNGADDQQRYVRGIYNDRNYDTGFWAYNTVNASAVNYNGNDLVITPVSGATGTYVQTSDSTLSTSANVLSYKPTAGHVVQMRVKFENMQAVSGKEALLRLYHIKDNATSGVDASNPTLVANLNASYFDGEYHVFTAELNSAFTSASVINAIRPQFVNLTNVSGTTGKIYIDYVYIGAEENAPYLNVACQGGHADLETWCNGDGTHTAFCYTCGAEFIDTCIVEEVEREDATATADGYVLFACVGGANGKDNYSLTGGCGFSRTEVLPAQPTEPEPTEPEPTDPEPTEPTPTEPVNPDLKNGIYLEGGLYYYYVNGEIQYAAGLVEVNGDYYYIRSGGYAAIGEYWCTNTNGITQEGFYIFGEDGKMLLTDTSKNGIYFEGGKYYYYVDGEIGFGAGLVYVDGYYYYIRSGGYAATGEYYVAITNGLMEEGMYTFGSDGRMIINTEMKNGIYLENGLYYYYVNGEIQYAAGLVEVNGDYYYIRSGGYAAIGEYWCTNTNGITQEGFYIFGEDGKMLLTDTSKNGIYFEGGKYYYYVDGEIGFGAGLVYVDGYYYYIRSGGYAATGEYYVAITNGLLPEGTYTFGNDGKMIMSQPEPTEPEPTEPEPTEPEPTEPEPTEPPVVYTETLINLADSGITVSGLSKPVTTSHDIIYYENRTTYASGNTYGEGTSADMHTAAEAAAHTVINITEPGIYRVTGTMSKAQIRVDLGEDAYSTPSAVVTLILDNVNLTCDVAPAILFLNVYECDGNWSTASAKANIDTTNAGANLVLEEGTTNNIKGSYVAKIYKDTADMKKLWKQDGAIYSYMSMNVSGGDNGTGTLNLTAGNEGLDTELHLTINSGNINIFSQDDAINTNEDGVSVTTINGGVLHLIAGLGAEGDGVDSNGYLVINGGAVIANARPGADGGLDADLGSYVNGGIVIALGSAMDKASTSSKQATMNLKFSSQRKTSQSILLRKTDGTVVLAYNPAADPVLGSQVRNYEGGVISCPGLVQGSSYYLTYGATINGTAVNGLYSNVTSYSGGTQISRTLTMTSRVMTFSGLS